MNIRRPEGAAKNPDRRHHRFAKAFWRTLKHHHLYLAPPVDAIALYQSCARFIERYNNKRKHSSLGYRTPAALPSGRLRDQQNNEL